MFQNLELQCIFISSFKNKQILLYWLFFIGSSHFPYSWKYLDESSLHSLNLFCHDVWLWQLIQCLSLQKISTLPGADVLSLLSTQTLHAFILSLFFSIILFFYVSFLSISFGFNLFELWKFSHSSCDLFHTLSVSQNFKFGNFLWKCLWLIFLLL